MSLHERKIDHENIVKVFEVKTLQESMWIIMEYCDLGDLNEFYKATNLAEFHDKKYSCTIVNIMKDIAKGIQFLHSKDVVHRDIKPANILIKKKQPSNSDGPKPEVLAKLSDFGLSKILDPEDETSSMSSDVGTMAFKAPEFWDRQPNQKIRYHRNVDVYSAGLTFAAMLQAQPQQNLLPKASVPLRSAETKMSVGLIAFTRNRNIRLCETSVEDTPTILGIKKLVHLMTRTRAEERLSAQQVVDAMMTETGMRNVLGDAMDMMFSEDPLNHDVAIGSRFNNGQGYTASISENETSSDFSEDEIDLFIPENESEYDLSEDETIHSENYSEHDSSGDETIHSENYSEHDLSGDETIHSENYSEHDSSGDETIHSENYSEHDSSGDETIHSENYNEYDY